MTLWDLLKIIKMKAPDWEIKLRWRRAALKWAMLFYMHECVCVCVHKRKSGNLNILRRKSLNQQKGTQHEYIHGANVSVCVCVGLNRGELISIFVLASLKIFAQRIFEKWTRPSGWHITLCTCCENWYAANRAAEVKHTFPRDRNGNVQPASCMETSSSALKHR